MEMERGRMELKMEGTDKVGSLFINVLIKKMIIEWYLIYSVSNMFLSYVISEVNINYNLFLFPPICMLILLFFIFVLNKWKCKINMY
jgi:hypothetical protein